MGNEDFNGQTLAEKLFKLNSSQQSIELLSHWCVSFRKKAKQIVEAWDRSFKPAQCEQRVSLLFLANDILQNSRRKGSEFVNEFWKVLPDIMKNVHENGDDKVKKVAARLVNIWEERKVFGARGLKDLLGKNSLLPVNSGSSLPIISGKSSNPIKILKKDSHSLRIKLAVGAMPEKIVSAFQVVHDENSNEETAIGKREGAISHVEELQKDVGKFCGQGGLQCSELIDKIKEQEDILRQSIGQLENAEATRVLLVSHLKEALSDQESMLQHIRNKLQVARDGSEQTANLRQRLTSPSPHALPANAQQKQTKKAVESNMQPAQLTNTPLSPSNLPVAPVASPKVNDEDSKKAAAAAVAAKLAASTSSAQMLTSILSSLVAEEAASLSSGLQPPGFSSLPFAPTYKRPRLDNNPEASNPSYFANSQQPVTNMPLGSSLGVQSTSQANQIQAPFIPPPTPPLGNTPPGKSVQSSGMMMGMMPYAYGAGNLPPPSLPGQIAMGQLRPSLQTQGSQQQIQQLQSPQAMQQQQQQSATGSYYRPPGIGFYGQRHQTSTPPVLRQ
ncbi:hypothetical protein Leryth_024916 [Lithospermum erythrorhizon]|nr:hypothetical protein Leryth_024916 [Lithospermum erythrorhizon]